MCAFGPQHSPFSFMLKQLIIFRPRKKQQQPFHFNLIRNMMGSSFIQFNGESSLYHPLFREPFLQQNDKDDGNGNGAINECELPSFYDTEIIHMGGFMKHLLYQLAHTVSFRA